MTQKQQRQFNVTLPDDWLVEIGKAASVDGSTKAEWIREAIKAQFVATTQRRLSPVKQGRPSEVAK